MRALRILFMTLMAGASTLAASAAGQNMNPMTGSQSDYIPTAHVRGDPGQWPSALNEYNNGVAALKAKKYRDAATDFRLALGGAPRDTNVWTMLGVAKEDAGDLKAAHHAYAQAVRFDDGNVAAHGRLGATAAWLGKADEAQAQLAELQQRLEACGGGCADINPLKAGIVAIQDAMAHPDTPTPPST